MIRMILAFVIVSVTVTAVAGPPPSPIPNNIRDACTAVKAWENSFRGKSEAEVAKVIGHDYEKDNWELLGKSELKIRYKIDKESTLLLLFQGDRVIQAEIYVLSEHTE